MNTRKTFLGRLGSTLGLLVLGGPRKLYAALRRPTTDEILDHALADWKWHWMRWTIPMKATPQGWRSLIMTRECHLVMEDGRQCYECRNTKFADLFTRSKPDHTVIEIQPVDVSGKR